MEDILEKEGFVRRLNTKGCCFLCLRIEDVSRADNVSQCYSVRQLLRHLQINENFNKISDSSAKVEVEGELIEVNLCKTCQKINGKVVRICQKLEKLQLELNYMLECIQTRVADSAKDSNRVQEYSRRMTSDVEALSQLAFVDKLRKELARKCLKMRNGRIPVIQLTKFKNGHKRPSIKQEQPSIENESDVEMTYGLSSPPSPSLDCADSTQSNSSSTPKEMAFDVNPHPEVLEQKLLPPLPSSSSTKQTVDASSSLKIKSTSKNNIPKKKQTRAYSRLLPQDVYCWKNGTSGIFHCKHCSSIFKSHRGVRRHYQTAHLQLKRKCNLCEKIMDPSSIRRHERSCLMNPARPLAKKNDSNFRFICKQCGKKFETRKKQRDHQLHVHRNANRYPCHLCDKKFTEQIDLKRHVDTVHLRKRYSCRFCNKSYASSYKTRAHEKNCLTKRKIKVEPEVNSGI